MCRFENEVAEGGSESEKEGDNDDKICELILSD